MFLPAKQFPHSPTPPPGPPPQLNLPFCVDHCNCLLTGPPAIPTFFSSLRPPQALCTCCSLCLFCFPQIFTGRLLFDIQVFRKTSPPQRGLPALMTRAKVALQLPSSPSLFFSFFHCNSHSLKPSYLLICCLIPPLKEI